jgi:hypothetical protein
LNKFYTHFETKAKFSVILFNNYKFKYKLIIIVLIEKLTSSLTCQEKKQ